MHREKVYLIEKPTQDITNSTLIADNTDEIAMAGCCFLQCRFDVMRYSQMSGRESLATKSKC